MAKRSKEPVPQPARETPAAEDTNARACVRVRVNCVALGEAGVVRYRDDIFETTPERAAALGELVTLAD